ncbi:MAG: DUF3054 domain-containing protein [Salinirussus sp.]
MVSASAIQPRIELAPRSLVLAVGDAGAILAFVAVGEVRHATDPLSDPGLVLTAAAPFLLGWMVVGILGGFYTRSAVSSVRHAALKTTIGWGVAVLVGAAIRATPAVRGDSPLMFILVTFGFGGLAIVGWRVLATFGMDSS